MKLTRRQWWLTLMILLPVFLVSGLLIMNLFSKRPETLGLSDGRLRECPASPNCVSSYATPSDREHSIEPLSIPGGLDQPLERLADVIESLPRSSIVTREENYLHAEFTTRWMRFVDDVEFQVLPDEQVIHVRSASRVGYSDLGANRKRVERIRSEWQKKAQP